MGIKRIVSTDFWDDILVIDVLTPEDRYFMLYLLTNPHTTQLGIYELSVSRTASELGYSREAVSALLDRFENRYGLIKRSAKSGEVAIKNYLRHSIVKGGKPVMDCLLKEESEVSDKSLLIYIYNHLINYKDTLNKTVLDFLKYINYKYHISNNNDNDNDNERIANDSYHDSYHESSEVEIQPSQPKVKDDKDNGKKIPPTMDDVRNYCDEVGSQIDPIAFWNFYDSKGWMVGKNKMKNWHSCIATWERSKGLSRIPKKPKKAEPQKVEKIDLDKWAEENGYGFV